MKSSLKAFCKSVLNLVSDFPLALTSVSSMRAITVSVCFAVASNIAFCQG
jgi:hypothetical protein